MRWTLTSGNNAGSLLRRSPPDRHQLVVQLLNSNTASMTRPTSASVIEEKSGSLANRSEALIVLPRPRGALPKVCPAGDKWRGDGERLR